MALVYYFTIREDWAIDDCWLWAQQHGAWLTCSPDRVTYNIVGMDSSRSSTEFALRFSEYIESVRRVEW